MTVKRMAPTRLFAALAAAFAVRSGLVLGGLALVVDKLDTVPEAQRSLYKEKDGKFHLDVDGYEDPAGLKTALQSERQRAKDLENQVKKWTAAGKTPEEIQALVDAQKAADEEKLKQAGKWDDMKNQMLGEHQKVLAAKDAELATAHTTLERYLVQGAAATELAAAKGSAALLMPHVRAATKVVKEGDEYVVRVVDAKGQPRVNGKGDFLTIKDLVAEMRESNEFARAFEASGTSGGGASGGGGSGGTKTMTHDAFNALPAKEQAAKMAEGYVVT